MTLLTRELRDVSLAVIDVETTGISAKSGARIVELAIVRVDAGRAPRVVLDTLVDPEGPVLCTSIHGIADEDVLGAPTFPELIGDLVLASEGALVAAFNASFDMGFIAAEGRYARMNGELRMPPHVCLMWLRPLLGLGKRCSLESACRQHGLRAGTHRAAEDALASAHMWNHYVAAAERRGIRTVSELADAGSHQYLSTLNDAPYARVDFEALAPFRRQTALKPRQQPILPPLAQAAVVEPLTHGDRHGRARVYWHALIDALSDGSLSAQELSELLKLQRSMAMPVPEIRAVHASVFAGRLREYADDYAVSTNEADRLIALRKGLAQLGWAPGDDTCAAA